MTINYWVSQTRPSPMSYQSWSPNTAVCRADIEDGLAQFFAKVRLKSLFAGSSLGPMRHLVTHGIQDGSDADRDTEPSPYCCQPMSRVVDFTLRASPKSRPI